MTVPDWWGFVLLGLASFRIWRLLAVDTVLDKPRAWVTGINHYLAGNPAGYRARVDEFIGCPWCFGFWIVLGWWGLWQVWEYGFYVMSVPLALSAAVGFLAKADS